MTISKGFLCDQSYKTAMTPLLEKLMAENSKPNPNIFPFLEVFYNFMQSREDAPLEVIWCYCFLKFRCLNLDRSDLLQRATGATELFLQISQCSVPCNPKRSIVLLAPLVFKVMNLLEDLSSERNSGSKLWNKACKSVRSLTSHIVGYISVFCSKDSEECDSASESSVSFDDLLNLWACDRRTMSIRHLPLVGLVVKPSIGNNLDNLSGNLMAEFFILKLYSDILFGNKGSQTEKELRSWSISFVNASQNLFFFDSIMMKLLESPMKIQGSEEEILLKTILYDAVILVDYRFLKPEKVKPFAGNKSKEILLKRVLIVCDATEFFRSRGDHKRVCSYNNSLSNSKFYTQMIKQCVDGVAIEEETEKLKGLPSLSLLKWLVELEVKGVKLFSDTEIFEKAKLVVKEEGMGSKAENILPDCELFYIDNKGSEENVVVHDDNINDSASAAFVAAAQTMMGQSGKKRKGEANEKEKKRERVAVEEAEEDAGSSSTSDGSLVSQTESDNPTDDD